MVTTRTRHTTLEGEAQKIDGVDPRPDLRSGWVVEVLRQARAFAAMCLGVTLLVGCAGRPDQDVLRETSVAVPGARPVTVFVATNRRLDPTGSEMFSTGRTLDLSYAQFTISIPPVHRNGKIEWPGHSPDARTDFVTLRHATLDGSTFQTKVAEGHGRGKADVAVFVHGYNTNFPEALFRLAQMTADAGGDGVPILFAWPSDGAIAGYVADKDAATASRDQLVALLTRLAADQRIGRISVIGHSMGGWLTVEAVRQLRLTDKSAVVRRLKVVLAAPDIDVEVFRAQMEVIGPLTPPLTVLVSKDDGALDASRLLAGNRLRLGQLDVADPRVQDATRTANVEVVDISQLEADDTFKHSRFAALAAYYPKFAGDRSARNGGIRRAGAFVFDTLGATVSSPFTLVDKTAFGQ